MNRNQKIYATKKWLIEQAGKQAAVNSQKSFQMDDVLRHITEALCQCALANGYSSGVLSAKTDDGMEWSVKFEQFGRRNPKTGKIDRRIKRKEVL